MMTHDLVKVERNTRYMQITKRYKSSLVLHGWLVGLQLLPQLKFHLALTTIVSYHP
jgi:hypothetical protein